MSSKLEKILRKLSSKEFEKFLILHNKIKSGDITGLDFKKLEGSISNFRVRFGNYRIIYEKINNEFFIVEVKSRNDNTYK